MKNIQKTLVNYLSAKLFPRFAFIENDIWTILPSPGDPNRDLYTRAAVAQYGTFALKKPESAYFSASIDIEDEPLDSKISETKRMV